MTKVTALPAVEREERGLHQIQQRIADELCVLYACDALFERSHGVPGCDDASRGRSALVASLERLCKLVDEFDGVLVRAHRS